MIDVGLIFQLFVLINPLSSLPFIIVAYKNGVNVRRLSYSAVLTAYIIAIVIAIIGPMLFNVFGITLHSFRIAGGVILFLLALDTIRSKEEEADQHPGELDSLVAILATPLLTGPATISFITLKAYEMNLWMLLSNITVAFLFVGGIFIIISYTICKINIRLIEIVSKILALFLTAMAIEMMATGIQGFIK